MKTNNYYAHKVMVYDLKTSRKMQNLLDTLKKVPVPKGLRLDIGFPPDNVDDLKQNIQILLIDNLYLPVNELIKGIKEDDGYRSSKDKDKDIKEVLREKHIYEHFYHIKLTGGNY